MLVHATSCCLIKGHLRQSVERVGQSDDLSARTTRHASLLLYGRLLDISPLRDVQAVQELR